MEISAASVGGASGCCWLALQAMHACGDVKVPGLGLSYQRAAALTIDAAQVLGTLSVCVYSAINRFECY
jgi:hypothetical protein